MSSDPIDHYQAIGEALSGAAKHPWDRIIVDATVDGVRVDVVVSFWRDAASESVEYLTGIPRLARTIYDLARLLGDDQKGYFKKLNFVLYASGKFNVDFTY